MPFPHEQRLDDRPLPELGDALRAALTGLERIRGALGDTMPDSRRDVVNATAAARQLEHLHWEWSRTRCSEYPRLHGRIVRAIGSITAVMPRLRLALGMADRAALEAAVDDIEQAERRLRELEQELEHARSSSDRFSGDRGPGRVS